MNNKVLFITGTRADFGKQKTLIKQAQEFENFDVHLFATGMHTLSKYGYTVNELYKEEFQNIYSFINQQEYTPMDLILSNTIVGLSNYVHELKPDLIVVHGDRLEPLAGSIVGALNNIYVAHIEGGEISGTIDETIRHAITKLSNFHFVSNDEARKRLLQMGEDKKSIFVIGSPDIDVMLSPDLPVLQDVKEKYEIDFKEYAILVYHSVVTDLVNLKTNIENVLQSLLYSELSYVVIYPNNDPGSEIIENLYEKHKTNNKFKFFPSMRFEYFLSLLKNTDFIIGNSSAGIREAPVYGVPTINLGSRQKNRYNSDSIFNVSENTESINEIIRKIRGIRFETNNYFGSGNSAELFIQEISKSTFWEIPKQKQFLDVNF